MTETKKGTTANYTPEMEDSLREGYNPKASEAERKTQVIELAETLGKNAQSVRSKLVRMGLYVKNAPKTKTGAKVETKETIVFELAEIMGVDADAQLSGLEKATKNCLLFLRTFAQVAAKLEREQDKEATPVS